MRSVEEFRKPFQSFAEKLHTILAPMMDCSRLLGDLRRAQDEAEQLATQDRVTYALNRRGAFWHLDNITIRSVAKIDMYDMRQANKVYGVSAVDTDLRRLSYQLRQCFPQSEGNYVRRSPGSDEFFVLSMHTSITQLRQIMRTLHRDDQSDLLIPWDYGIGTTEEAADLDLRNRRGRVRPAVLRQVRSDNHSEIPRTNGADDPTPSWDEFSQSYRSLEARLRACQLRADLLDELLSDLWDLQAHAESEVTADELTNALNWIGKKWYLGDLPVKAVALTDMHNMHEGNLRYGPDAIDRDLYRFSKVLLEAFRRDDGFLVVRSEKAGDEFQVASLVEDIYAFHERFQTFHRHDASRGLLSWHFGIGQDETEAFHRLYANIVRPNSTQEVRTAPMSTNRQGMQRSFFLLARPSEEDHRLLSTFAQQIATAVAGRPLDDLHCTMQSIGWEGEIPALCEQIEQFCKEIRPFDIEFQHAARVSVANFPGRIWLMAKKSQELEAVYLGMIELGKQLQFQTYVYPVDEWRPHMKIAVLEPDAPPTIASAVFGRVYDVKFRVHSLTLTCQVSPHEWQRVAEFRLV